MLLCSNVLGYVSGIFGLFNSFRLTLIFVDDRETKLVYIDFLVYFLEYFINYFYKYHKNIIT